MTDESDDDKTKKQKILADEIINTDLSSGASD